MPKQGLGSEGFNTEIIGGKEYLRIIIRNLKNRKEHTKIIPIPLDIPIEKKFAEILNIQWEICELDKPLFEIGKRRAQQIISKSGWHAHFLRKLRLTHLAKYYNFSDQKLKLFAGWSDSRPSKAYIKLSWEDLAKSMHA